MSLREEIKRYIRENLMSGDESVSLGEEDSLIERGIIDSMGLMQLMMFVDERTGIRIPDSEVTLDNFETVASIDQMVDRLRQRIQCTARRCQRHISSW